MGLFSHHIHTLCREQKKENLIKGDILTLGQQSVWIKYWQARKILKKYNLSEFPLKRGFDYSNKAKAFENTNKAKNPSAQALLTMMGANNVEAIDFSDYEDADIIHDLNFPVSKNLLDKYDAILDIGSTEHIFDLPMVLKNMCDMLKPGGSLFLSYPCSNYIDHGFYSISPTLLFDFFKINGFSNLRAYLREGSSRIYDRKGRLFEYNHTIKEKPIVSSGSIEVLFFAQKTSDYNSNQIKKPIQFIYNSSEDSINHKTPSKFKKIILALRNILLFVLKYLPYELERVCFNFIRRRKSLKYIGRF